MDGQIRPVPAPYDGPPDEYRVLCRRLEAAVRALEIINDRIEDLLIKQGNHHEK